MRYLPYFNNRTKWLLFVLLLQTCGILQAQKYHYYTGNIAQYNFDFLFTELPNGDIEGYYLDNLTRDKINITGHYHALGEYWALQTSDPRANFRLLVLRRDEEKKKLKGHYYSIGKAKGFCELKETAYPEYFEIRQDLSAFSTLYKKIYTDAELFTPRQASLFQMEPVTGKLYFDEDAGKRMPSGLSINPRKMIEMNNIRIIVDDLSWESKEENYQRKLYFQILSYHPSMRILVVAEEQIQTIKNQTDTSFQQIYSFAVYEESMEGDNWTNISNTAFPEYQKERLYTKMPTADYVGNAQYFRLRFTDKPKTTLYCNTPRTNIFVPNEKGEQMVLDWSWTEKGFTFR